MIITFGDFKDQSVESLKLSKRGVSYLEWGARNLKSPVWRKEFQRVLDSITDHDHAMIMVREDGIAYDEAMRHLAEMKIQEDEDEAIFKAEAKRRKDVLARWSAEVLARLARSATVDVQQRPGV